MLFFTLQKNARGIHAELMLERVALNLPSKHVPLVFFLPSQLCNFFP